MPLKRAFLLRGLLQRRRMRLASWVERILFAGIHSTDRLVRRRQLFTNIAAYVTGATAFAHFVGMAFHNFNGLLIAIAYNGSISVFCILNHRLHAFGDRVAAITLTIGLILGHLFIVFAVGTASDLQFYFPLAVFIFFIVGVENLRICLALYAMSFVALLVALAFALPNGFVLPEDVALRRSLSVEAALNAFLMNGLLFAFALTAQQRAEERSEALLSALLPQRIAERLKESPYGRIADRAEDCSVLFLDLVGFTEATRNLEPGHVVAYLDAIYSRLDAACERLGVDKIKTIGDSYMAVGGLSGEPAAGARAIGLLALEFIDSLESTPALGDSKLEGRAGIHAGLLTAGVIGDLRVSYDVWGDTVNLASRLESHGVPGRIHVSAAYKDLAAPYFEFTPRGEIEMKGLGIHATYFLSALEHDPEKLAGFSGEVRLRDKEKQSTTDSI